MANKHKARDSTPPEDSLYLYLRNIMRASITVLKQMITIDRMSVIMKALLNLGAFLHISCSTEGKQSFLNPISSINSGMVVEQKSIRVV
jgi:hypothetical protein